MAILKAINHRRYKFTDLLDIDNYITDPAKSELSCIGGYGCPPELWVSCNKALKSQYHAKHKKQFRHFVIGFDDRDKASIATARAVGYEACKHFAGYYAKFAVHTNTNHLHLHIIVGNTSYEDGKQLDMPKAALVELKTYCSDVLMKHGCSGVRMWKWSVCDAASQECADDILEIPESMFCIPTEKILYHGIIPPENIFNTPYNTAVWNAPQSRWVAVPPSITEVVSVPLRDSPASHADIISYYVVEAKPMEGMINPFSHICDSLEEAVNYCATMPSTSHGDIRKIIVPFQKIK